MSTYMTLEEYYETKYCPECGAKMENNGDDDDE